MYVCDEVLGVWDAERQRQFHAAESFGVLVGTTSVDKKEVWIEAVTTPMPLDRRSRFWFELRDPGHQHVVVREARTVRRKADLSRDLAYRPSGSTDRVDGRQEGLAGLSEGEPGMPACVCFGWYQRDTVKLPRDAPYFGELRAGV